MKPYEVKLEFFEGPLDLLLFLIKKEDMDIRDIQISKITQEYLATIHLLKELNLELAGEFLVMASTLMQIKAHTLLPEEAKLEALADGPDPRAELVAKLLEYQKFKEAAKILSEKELEVKEIYYRNSLPIFEPDDFSMDATLFDLLDAFKKVLKDASQELKELLYEEIPLEQKIREILDVLEQKESLAFIQIFESSRTKREFIITFLALLELIRLKQIVAKQTELFGEIRIYKLEEAVTQNPLVSGENQPLSN
ncbi:MAG: hypothetical protein A3I11_07345 [Elusimicrobia bacterium RIFCSPLOWO2_02_FULL_39_32]|nr:MAG: hypothetical protein A3B80_05280 [Elusimicrobia bacterium RIFCSPHIGHO2_02_FULL_39_36]OGR91999.1 MAG: hypothetical protein A3I11_07345 [Elusimicrobia bacterium RIFCSPLOWO2_02_FULL_39_32]OGR98710.1 MAG: hypothetical protein A3G85_05085 [Elusimicrobia bacterium RIFCSPLOWO2_12_FULL_39_28]